MKQEDYDSLIFCLGRPEIVQFCKNSFVSKSLERFFVRKVKKQAPQVLANLSPSTQGFTWHQLFITHSFSSLETAQKHYDLSKLLTIKSGSTDYSSIHLFFKTDFPDPPYGCYLQEVISYHFSGPLRSLSISVTL